MQALLGDRERRRDLLIEHLHLLQDQFGCLHARHLVALAEEMRLALAEVYEVASFYAHFDIVMDDEAPPPPVTVRVCDSLTCALSGGEQLLDDLRDRLGDGVRVVRAPCMGGCDKAPVVAIGHALHENATVGQRRRGGRGRATRIRISRPIPVSTRYRADGGYALLQACLAGERTVDGSDRGARRFGAARARRRRVSDRAQMALRAAGAGAAADGGQRRRGRARHLQGPLLSSKPTRTAFSRAC